MGDVFVKSFKRDYAYLSRLETAEAVMQQLPTWFEDYNEVHPHQALRMKSPREYRRALMLFFAVAWLLRGGAIDRCLDSGGCWDAERKACEMQDQSRCKPLP
jgi:hypothetical protein